MNIVNQPRFFTSRVTFISLSFQRTMIRPWRPIVCEARLQTRQVLRLKLDVINVTDGTRVGAGDCMLSQSIRSTTWDRTASVPKSVPRGFGG